MGVMIKIENVVFSYPDEEDSSVKALQGVNLTIDQGEFVAIVGHNGSGKSTLSKLLNAVYPPDSGTILIDGLDTSKEENLWEIRRRAGMVFQNPDNQMVASIIEEDVAFGPENLGVPTQEIRSRVDRALEIVGMENFKRRSPNHLSGGQKQRVAIAGILAMNSECVIFDEPTAMLDPSGRKEVLQTIHALNKIEHKTILLITHYMDEAVQADRVVVMDSGKIVLSGKPREVFTEIERIHSLGLDVPQAMQIAHELRALGVEVDPHVLNVKELLKSIESVRSSCR